MIEVIQYPKREEYPRLFTRPALEQSNLSELVNQVFHQIQQRGDEAVKEYTEQFDRVKLSDFRVTEEEIQTASESLNQELKQAIDVAIKNITTFHQTQKKNGEKVETAQGVTCWREQRAIEKVGIYVPGGTAPLFSSVMMLGIPATIAGCEEIILCSPPNENGQLHPAIAYTANRVGVTNIFKIGGIQAIAAMTFGTETVPAVSKLFGPGNQYVTAAKQQAQLEGMAIDMPAGPSEVLVIADQHADPAFVASDLLAQAEHGVDSQSILLSDHEPLFRETITEINKQVEPLPRKDIVLQSLQHSQFLLLHSIEECVVASNHYAPEHLILALQEPSSVLSKIKNAGSVFLGQYSCESLGDYASGTNHTLPTNGYARSYSGVSVDSFVKQITFQEVTKQGMKTIGPAVETLAEAEQLQAHKQAVSIRLKSLNQ